MRDDPAKHAPVRIAQHEDAGAVADILADAFADDPVMNWVFGASRPFRTIFFELAHGLFLKSGFGHIIEGCGATLWLPAGNNGALPFINELRILGAALPTGGMSAVLRAKKTGEIMKASHPSPPHFYLYAVGVRNNMKGRGIGGLLIREGLKIAKKSGAPSYLENSNPKNRPLYERLGFQATAPLDLPAGAPPLLGMLHEPGGATP